MFGKIIRIQKNENIKSILFYLMLILGLSFIYAYLNVYRSNNPEALQILNRALIFSVILNTLLFVFRYFEGKYIKRKEEEQL